MMTVLVWLFGTSKYVNVLCNVQEIEQSTDILYSIQKKKIIYLAFIPLIIVILIQVKCLLFNAAILHILYIHHIHSTDKVIRNIVGYFWWLIKALDLVIPTLRCSVLCPLCTFIFIIFELLGKALQFFKISLITYRCYYLLVKVHSQNTNPWYNLHLNLMVFRNLIYKYIHGHFTTLIVDKLRTYTNYKRWSTRNWRVNAICNLSVVRSAMFCLSF